MPFARVTRIAVSKIWLTGTPGFMAAMAAISPSRAAL